MKIRDVMTSPVVKIGPEENLCVASRLLTQYNIGAMPVCGMDGRLCGVITDRDIVTRCLSAGKLPEQTKVREAMSAGIRVVRPDMDVETAGLLMSGMQIRRLPVMENGRLCGMVTLGDLARHKDTEGCAAGILRNISCGLSARE